MYGIYDSKINTGRDLAFRVGTCELKKAITFTARFILRFNAYSYVLHACISYVLPLPLSQAESELGGDGAAVCMLLLAASCCVLQRSLRDKLTKKSMREFGRRDET